MIQIFTRQFPNKSDKKRTKSRQTQPQSNSTILSVLLAMIDAPTEGAYLALKSKFDSLTENSPDIRDYFTANWSNCLPMWVKAYKKGSITYLNDTNNPVETLNSTLKKHIKRASTMFNCLKGIFNCLADLKRKHNYNSYINR